MRGIVKPTAR